MNTPDRIFISAIDCVAAIGVTAEERAIRQRLSVDVEVFTDVRAAAASDSLEHALDYAQVVALVSHLAQSREFNLIETLAEAVAAGVLDEIGGDAVRVVVRKTPPPLAAGIGFVSVEIVRNRAKRLGKKGLRLKLLS